MFFKGVHILRNQNSINSSKDVEDLSKAYYNNFYLVWWGIRLGVNGKIWEISISVWA